MFHDGYWWLLVVFLRFLVVLGGSWQFLVVFGGFGGFLAVFEGS